MNTTPAVKGPQLLSAKKLNRLKYKHAQIEVSTHKKFALACLYEDTTLTAAADKVILEWSEAILKEHQDD
jgi:hypothetical protein